MDQFLIIPILKSLWADCKALKVYQKDSIEKCTTILDIFNDSIVLFFVGTVCCFILFA